MRTAAAAEEPEPARPLVYLPLATTSVAAQVAAVVVRDLPFTSTVQTARPYPWNTVSFAWRP